MFNLATKQFPTSATDLAALLQDNVTRLTNAGSDAVTVTDGTFPHLRAIQVRLDGASLRPKPLARPRLQGEVSPALQVDTLQLSAQRFSIGPATVDLRLDAADVYFDQGKDERDEIILLLRKAATGRIEVSALKSEIEQALTAVAQAQAAKQGVTIERVELSIRATSERVVEAEARVHARKLLFRTLIHISARLALNEHLEASLSGLECRGDGAIGAIACGVLQPHLQKLNGRTFPLLALPLGEVRLRDVRLAADEQLRVTAEFGA